MMALVERRKWCSVTRSEPCPICGKPDKCTANGDAVCCWRKAEAPSGWRIVKHPANGGTIFAPDDQATSPDRFDWARRAKDFQAALPQGELSALAKQLHVSPDALKRIGVGWNRHQHVYTFPESDASGQIVGINRRWIDGRQKAMHKSRRGLVLLDGVDRTKPLLIPEGASDVAAAVTVELQAVGRPSARGGIEHLTELLADWSGEIIVVGENDRKKNGNWPGRDGAIRVAGALARRLGRSFMWALPPDDAKDLREWVQREAPDLANAEARAAAGVRITGALRDSS